MSTEGFQERRGRETRLLVLVVGVSIAVLLLLAQFRFPEADLSTTPPTSSPLAGLAGRASFDDLALTMNALLGRVSPQLAIVELGATGEGGSGTASGGEATAAEPADVPVDTEWPARTRLVVALRVAPDVALVHVPAGWEPLRYAGAEVPVEVVAADPARRLSLLRTTTLSEFRSEPSTDVFMGLAYVGAFDATTSGPTVEPVFVGRVGTRTSERWPAALYTLGSGTTLQAGTFLFSFDGRLVGLVVRGPEGPAIVPASVLDAVVDELLSQEGPVS